VAGVAGRQAHVHLVSEFHPFRLPSPSLWPGLYRPRVVLTDAVDGTVLAVGLATVSVARP
jgi:hypothetical protein